MSESLYLCSKVTTIILKIAENHPKMLQHMSNVKHYLRNLWIAIKGAKPYRMELERAEKKSDETAEKVNELQASISGFEKMMDDLEKKEKSYQSLTENLREHLADKDKRIAELRMDMEKTLGRLQESNHALAKQMVAQSLLDKTNNALEDLCSAMQSGDMDQILSVSENMDWSNAIPRIVQQHVMVLRRKNELAERLK